MLGTFKFQSVNALIAKNQWAGAYFLHQFICVLYASIAMGCCWHFEAAAGSGIPEIKAFLNGVNLKQFVRSRVLLAKLVGMCFSVASGIPTGKKGPIIHIGASLGAVVSQGGRTLGFDASWQQFQDLRNDKSKRDFVTYGIAAGVASMFRSPIGGVLFALEEGASFWSSTLTFRAFFCAMMTLFTVSILLTDGNFGTADSSSLFVFGQFHDLELGRTNYRMYELFIFILMGVSGGVIGALWNAMVKRLTVYYMKNYTEKRQKAMRVLIFAFAMGSIAFFMPLMWQVCSKKPSGDDIADWGAEELQLLDKLVAFQCPEGYYNQVASLFFTGGEDAIRQLYHFREYMGSSYSTFDAGPLLLFMIPYGIMMSSTAGLFVPLGLFVPSLLLGAAYGRLWGHVLNTLFPGYVADSGTYAMMGSCAINGGITRMTISMTIIMLETAGNMTYLLPLMVTFGAARYTGNALGPGIYDIQLALKEFPFLESSLHTLGLLNYNPVTEIMSSPVVTFQEIEKVGNIVRALKSTTHNGYPVVEMNGKLRGLIPRKILTSLLNWKAFSAPESGSILRSASSRRFSVASEAEALPDNAIQLAPPATTVFYDSVEKQYPNYPAIESIELSEEEMVCWSQLLLYVHKYAF
jgi:H+/Cl- antiporter ClcA